MARNKKELKTHSDFTDTTLATSSTEAGFEPQQGAGEQVRQRLRVKSVIVNTEALKV